MSWYNKPKPVKNPVPTLNTNLGDINLDPLMQQKYAQMMAQQPMRSVQSGPSIRELYQEVDELRKNQADLFLTIKLRFLYDIEEITKEEYKSIGKMMHSADPENWVVAQEIILQKMKTL